MTVVLPFNLPRQQLPQPTDRLSDGFLHALPAPVGLWMPSKLAQAAADFTPLPQKHFGSLNGGITTTASGFGVLGAQWKIGTTSSYWKATGISISPSPITFIAAVNSTIPGSFQTAIAFDSGLNNGCRMGLNNAGQLLFTLGGVADYAFTSLSLPANVNYFVAISWTGNGGTATGYLAPMGGAIATQSLATGTLSGTPSQITVGGMQASANSWKGVIALAGAFNGVLSRAQFSSLYNSLLTGEPYPLFQPQTTELFAGSGAAVTSKVPWPLLFGRAA